MHILKRFFNKRESSGSIVAGTATWFNEIFLICDENPTSSSERFQEVSSLDSQISVIWSKRFCIKKNPVSETKKGCKHNCQNTPVIWGICSFDCRIPTNFCIRAVKFQCFQGRWANQNRKYSWINEHNNRIYTCLITDFFREQSDYFNHFLLIECR